MRVPCGPHRAADSRTTTTRPPARLGAQSGHSRGFSHPFYHPEMPVPPSAPGVSRTPRGSGVQQARSSPTSEAPCVWQAIRPRSPRHRSTSESSKNRPRPMPCDAEGRRTPHAHPSPTAASVRRGALHHIALYLAVAKVAQLGRPGEIIALLHRFPLCAAVVAARRWCDVTHTTILVSFSMLAQARLGASVA